MKIIYSIILCILYSVPVSQADETKQKKIQILKDKITKQEQVLQALKNELVTLEKAEQDVLSITINLQGLLIDKKPSTTEGLVDRLKHLPKDINIKIISDASIEYKKVVSLIDTISKEGFYNISFSTFDRKAKTETKTIKTSKTQNKMG